MEQTTQEQFLADITKEEPVDAFATQVSEKGEEDVQGNSEEDGTPRNRRERRLMEKLAAERESSMFLAGKLEARNEAERAVTEEADYLKSVERIYGTDSPEAQIATDLLKKAIVGARDDAKREALEEMRAEFQKGDTEVREAENELDGFIEDIEDTYKVSLTGAQEKAYFTLLEKMSPKDRDGSVKEYADPHAVWEIFSERMQKRTDTRAKDLSSRSMVQSGASTESNLQDDVSARWLRENGII